MGLGAPGPLRLSPACRASQVLTSDHSPGGHLSLADGPLSSPTPIACPHPPQLWRGVLEPVPGLDPTCHDQGHTGTAEGHGCLLITVVDIKIETTFTHPSGPPSIAVPASPPGHFPLDTWDRRVPSLPAKHPSSDPDLPPVDGDLQGPESGDRVEGPLSQGQRWGKACWWWEGPPGMPPDPASGRVALMLDSWWRLLPCGETVPPTC